MLDWHTCQICYPLEIKLLLLLLLLYPTFVIEDHMLDWHTCQICYPLEIKLLLLLLLLYPSNSFCLNYSLAFPVAISPQVHTG